MIFDGERFEVSSVRTRVNREKERDPAVRYLYRFDPYRFSSSFHSELAKQPF
jgi:hypothetical protein